MPRPLKQLNPYGSWAVLFGATLRKLRLESSPGRALTQEELGKRIAYSGATVSAVERGDLRPDITFVEACERELAGAVILADLFPFVVAEWDCRPDQGLPASARPHPRPSWRPALPSSETRPFSGRSSRHSPKAFRRQRPWP